MTKSYQDSLEERIVENRGKSTRNAVRNAGETREERERGEHAQLVVTQIINVMFKKTVFVQ